VKAVVYLCVFTFLTLPLFGDSLANKQHEQKSYKLCITPIWEPFSFLNKQAKFDGILADYEKLISEKSGISFAHVYTIDYKQNKQFLREGKCDVALADVKNETNSKHYLITKPYATFPRAYATHIDTPWAVDFSHLLDNNKKVGVVFGAPAKRFLQKNYPNIEVIEYKNTEAGLKALSAKSIIAFVNILPTIAYTIQINGFNDLKIGGYLKGDIPLSMFINKKHPTLYNRLNNSIMNVSEQERLDILDQWVHIQKGIAYDTVFRFVLLGLFLFSVISLLLYISRRSNKRLRNLLNASIEGVILFTNGVVTGANKPAIKLFGYKNHAQIKGKKIEEIYAKKVLHNGEISEAELKKADGTSFIAHIKFSSFDEFHSSTIISVVDLTKLKQTQQALQELNTTLQQKVEEELAKNLHQQFLMIQQNRFAQMGEMISMIAHQWRQPLNNLSLIFQTFIFKYQMKKLDDETLKQLAQESKNQIDFMSGTIDDFRDFFKPSREKSEFLLDEVIRESVDIIKPVLKKEGISITLSLDDKIKLFLYASELKQVLINILNNAKDALMESDKEEKQIKVSTIQESDHIKIKISDNAGGVPDEIIDRIFDPYFSTKTDKNGTGIGLYMSKKIVEEYLEGTLSVVNENKGAIFKIILYTSKNKGK